MGLIVRIVLVPVVHREYVSERAHVPSHWPGFVTLGTSRFRSLHQISMLSKVNSYNENCRHDCYSKSPSLR